MFNIAGNKYRLLASIKYWDDHPTWPPVLFVKFIGTHAEYDVIDVATHKQHEAEKKKKKFPRLHEDD